jgi:hypothetical protein
MSRHSAAFILSCLCVAVSLASEFKSAVVTTSTLTIVVPDKHFLLIRNFTQEGNSSPRGVVVVSFATPAPTATPTPSGTPTPPPSPTPTPTPTPTPPPQTVLTATIIDPASPPGFIKPVTVSGPVTLTVAPVPGAKLFITYRKFSEPTPTPTATP